MLNTVNMNLIIPTLHVFGGHLEKCWSLGTEFYSISRNHLNPSFHDIIFLLSIFDHFLLPLSMNYCYLEEARIFIHNVLSDPKTLGTFPIYINDVQDLFWARTEISFTQIRALPDFKTAHEVLLLP